MYVYHYSRTLQGSDMMQRLTPPMPHLMLRKCLEQNCLSKESVLLVLFSSDMPTEASLIGLLAQPGSLYPIPKLPCVLEEARRSFRHVQGDNLLVAPP